MEKLINQVSGILAAHHLLSQTEWAPVHVDALCRLIIKNCVQGHSTENHIQVKVLPAPTLVEARGEGAVVTTSEAVMYEAVGVAATDEFRALLRIVKEA